MKLLEKVNHYRKEQSKQMPRKEIWSEGDGRGLKRDFRGTIIKCNLQKLNIDSVLFYLIFIINFIRSVVRDTY